MSEGERVLADHPEVREVVVIGVPDRRWGEIVKAVVVPRDATAPPELDGLRAFARDRMAPFKAVTPVHGVGRGAPTCGDVHRSSAQSPLMRSCSRRVY